MQDGELCFSQAVPGQPNQLLSRGWGTGVRTRAGLALPSCWVHATSGLFASRSICLGAAAATCPQTAAAFLKTLRSKSKP